MTGIAAPARTAPPGGTARMIGNETAKGLRILWAYRATLLPTLFGLRVTYLAFQYFVGGSGIDPALAAETAPGMFAYAVSYLMVMRMVAGLLEERNAGTLEQLHLSPLAAWQLAVGRVAAAMAEAVLIAVVVLGAALITIGVEYPVDLDAVVPLGLLLAGIAGFALLIAAASFTYPGIGALVHIIQMALMMLNGAIVPPEVFPRWLELVAKFAPATLGVDAIRRVLVDDRTLGDLWASGTLGWLTVHTAVLVTVGWVAYQTQVRRALRDGRLGPA